MKRVSKNYVAKQVVFRTIVDVKRRVELKITADVASKTDCRRVFRAALPVDLHSPCLIEIIRVAEDCFVFVAGMNGSSDQLVMLSVIASFNIRLRIYV